MFPSKLNQATLQHQADTFITNAADEELSAILATVGCNADCLAEGATLLATWRAALNRAEALKGAQKQATLTQKAAHTAARIDMVRLAKMVRGEFAGNDPLLTRLGLQTKTKANGSQPAPNGQQPPPTNSQPTANGDQPPTNGDQPQGETQAQAGQPTEPATPDTGKRRSGPKGQSSLAADLARWRRLCANLDSLSEAEQSQLAQVNWSRSRRLAAAAKVEAVAEADIAQQVAIQAKESALAEASAYEKQLRRWYLRVVRLAKAAIEQHDPENRERRLKQLGL